MSRAEARHATALGLVLVSFLTGAANEAHASECPAGAQETRVEAPHHYTDMCVDGDGKIDGRLTTRSATGQLLGSGLWDQGLQTGPWETYFANGEVRSSDPFERGVKEGAATLWFESGQRKTVTTFSQGVRNGAFAAWDASGRQTTAGQFRDDLAYGTWVFSGRGGSRISTQTFMDGKPLPEPLARSISCAEWSESRKPVREHFAGQLVLMILAVSNRPGPLAQGFPVSVELGQCLVGGASQVIAAIEEGCRQPEAERPLGPRATRAAREVLGRCRPKE